MLTRMCQRHRVPETACCGSRDLRSISKGGLGTSLPHSCKGYPASERREGAVHLSVSSRQMPLCMDCAVRTMSTGYPSSGHIPKLWSWCGERQRRSVQSKNIKINQLRWRPLGDGRGTVRLMRRVDWTCLSVVASEAKERHGCFEDFEERDIHKT